MNILLKYAIVGILSGFIAFLLSLTPVFELIELKCYDLFHLFKEKKDPPPGFVLVTIDEQSFDYFKKQWPWPRAIHAKLIETLKERGASVIGMDIVFSEPSRPEEDEALSRALKKRRNVVLASILEEVVDRQYRLEKITKPLPDFMEASYEGLINVPLDIDGVVRRIPMAKAGEDLFSTKIAEIYSSKKISMPEGRYISFTGPPRSFKTISYYQASDPDYFLPKGFFNGKIVIVGMGLKTLTDPNKTFMDLFSTPYIFAGEWSLMHGIEIQANIVNNILKGDSVNRMGKYESLILFLVIGLIGSFYQIRWKPFSGFLLVFFSILFYLVVSIIIFKTYRFWAPIFISIIPFSLPYVGFGIEAYIRSEKKRREIRKAFSYYVSPSVLELILENPEMLTLGGKKEDVTVLFADIANFTTMAESLAPEELVKLLNRFFSEMTRIVFEYNGMVDKFIGDAIMAVWGCPVKDDEHALKASLTAIAIMKRMKTFRQELKKSGYPEINISIGISSGEVIAGNMGSIERFDYTVVGDAVNLASRLQGSNKDFGTSILIDGNVYNKVYGKIDLRPLGKIEVRGKTKMVDVYEIKCD